MQTYRSNRFQALNQQNNFGKSARLSNVRFHVQIRGAFPSLWCYQIQIFHQLASLEMFLLALCLLHFYFFITTYITNLSCSCFYCQIDNFIFSSNRIKNRPNPKFDLFFCSILQIIFYLSGF